MKEPTLSSVSAFFPCYNDANTIVGLVRTVEAALAGLTDDYEVIVVNDCSTDTSLQVLQELQQSTPRLRIVDHVRNLGYGGALRSGFNAATKDFVFYTDGDGQYDPSEIRLLAEAMEPSVDVVNGFKISRQDPWYRHLVGGMYQRATRLMFAFPISDVDCDFRLLRRGVFDRIRLESNDGAICIELVRKLKDARYRMVEVPVHHYARAYGSSQFFKPKRIARALIGVSRWYIRLVLLKQQERQTRTLVRKAQEAGAVGSGGG